MLGDVPGRVQGMFHTISLKMPSSPLPMACPSLISHLSGCSCLKDMTTPNSISQDALGYKEQGAPAHPWLQQ